MSRAPRIRLLLERRAAHGDAVQIGGSTADDEIERTSRVVEAHRHLSPFEEQPRAFGAAIDDRNSIRIRWAGGASRSTWREIHGLSSSGSSSAGVGSAMIQRATQAPTAPRTGRSSSPACVNRWPVPSESLLKINGVVGV